MSSATRATNTMIAGPAGPLQVRIDEPADGGEPQHVAVVCHPHPLFGGTMTNKVAHMLARTCSELGLPAVRFNFRGVDRSVGTHDDGRGEVDDVLAIVDWAEHRWPGADIWLAGFSFGAAMALRASLRHPVARLITVAPALRWLEGIGPEVPSCPWLIVQGDQDELVDAQAVTAWAKSLVRAPQLEILPGAEHFFHGRLNDLRDIVKTWAVEA